MPECPYYCHCDHPFANFIQRTDKTNDYLVEKHDRDKLDAQRYRKLKAFLRRDDTWGSTMMRNAWSDYFDNAWSDYFDVAVDAMPNQSRQQVGLPGDKPPVNRY